MDDQTGKVLKMTAPPIAKATSANTPAKDVKDKKENGIKCQKAKADKFDKSESGTEEAEDLKRIIEEQKRLQDKKDQMLSFKDQDIIRQRALYEEAHAKEAKYETNRAEYEASRKELVTLREHRFQMMEDDINPEPDRLEKMKTAIAGKRIKNYIHGTNVERNVGMW